ncbi:hypothetical protein [Aporhodopirellula aestuarii]|uniref:Uncharacterized protein n=1 Tax=Aporhodopirellula aestuarii TaxID=2950107 RepID=A0ABT0U9W4_9BACT|nr:hypothetical protein [Aporhodopirellula aestuarii]MCM2373655.1 hypothetical protein [Aporhodopirellula aestuarii]
MNMQLIERQFTRIGARAQIHRASRRNGIEGITIDIGNDGDGEFFDIAVASPLISTTRVLDVQPSMRHLLLMADQRDGKHKFLCGHDERHWFVAAVPERAAVSTVQTAFDALKPVAVRALENRLGVKPRKRNRRRNEAFVRQGEWFFVPLPSDSFVNERLILRSEPIARGGGKPHLCEEVVRQGGELVYVAAGYPQGVTEAQRERLISRRPQLRNLHWVAQRRNPSVFVRGRVRHRDHKTIVLNGWHQVLMNTENESIAMRHVAFID